MKFKPNLAFLIKSAAVAFVFGTTAQADLMEFETATVKGQMTSLVAFEKRAWERLQRDLVGLTPGEIVEINLESTNKAEAAQQTAAGAMAGAMVRKSEGYFEYVAMGTPIDSAFYDLLESNFDDVANKDFGIFDFGFSVMSTEQEDETYEVRLSLFAKNKETNNGTYSLRVNGEYDISFPEGTKIMSTNKIPVGGGSQKTIKLISTDAADATLMSVDSQLQAAGITTEIKDLGPMKVLSTGAETGVVSVSSMAVPGEDKQSIVIVKVVSPN